MATEAQRTANRENARKSTGPRTPEGKLASSRNARIHGFSGRLDILTDEEALLYVQLSERYIREMQPVTLIEEELIKTIADCNWQLNRFRAIEEQMTREMCGDQLSQPGPLADLAIARAMRRDCEGSNALERFARYRAHFQRTLNQALREFDRRKAARLAESASPSSAATEPSANPEMHPETQPDAPQIGFDLQNCDSFQLLAVFKSAIAARQRELDTPASPPPIALGIMMAA